MDINEDKCFRAGLRVAIKQSGIKQGAWSEGVTSPVNLSNILRNKVGLSRQMIEALAEKAGMSVAEIIELGKEKDSTEQAPEPTSKQVDPMEVMAAVSALIGQCQKSDDRRRFWREVFECLPVAALVIRDNVVIYQNVKSRAFGAIVGGEMCESCIGKGCNNKAACPVTIAGETGVNASGFTLAMGQCWKMDVAAARYNDHQYIIVLATETGSNEMMDRRGNDDRRRNQSEDAE